MSGRVQTVQQPALICYNLQNTVLRKQNEIHIINFEWLSPTMLTIQPLKNQINTAIIQQYRQTVLILWLWLVSLKSILVVFTTQFVLFSHWILFMRKHHHLLEIVVSHSQTFYYKPQRNVVVPMAKITNNHKWADHILLCKRPA